MNPPSSSEEIQSTRIIELRSENFKRLKAVTIRPDGNMVRIVGKNGAGKSSVLDSIASALGGGDSLPGDPIRHGAKKAKIVLELEDLVVTRTFTKAGSTLVIEGKDGTPKKSPQELLNRLTGKVTFDPLLFLSLDPKRKLEALRTLLGIDTANIDAARLRAFNERTLVNRDLDQQKALVARLPHHADAPAAEESGTTVLVEMEVVRRHNESVSALRRAVDDANDEVSEEQKKHEALILAGAGIRDQIRELQSKLAGLEKAAEAQADMVINARQKLANATKESEAAEMRDTEPLRAKLAGLEAANAKVRANKQRAEAEAAARAKQAQSDALTRKIAECDEQKQALLQNAKFPVDGLALGEDGIVFKGVPLEQASDAEKLRVSVAIAAAMNPKLKIMLARNASLLDEDSLKLLAELAEKYGLQIWLEVVSSTDKTGVVIEDGHIAGEEVAETEEPARAAAPEAPSTEQPESQLFDLPPSR